MNDGERFGLPREAVQKLQSVFKKHPNVQQVILYGSRATGTAKAGSDIDLVILGKTVTTTELLQIETELDDLLLPYSIDLSVLHQIENQELLDHIQRAGKLFFQPQA